MIKSGILEIDVESHETLIYRHIDGEWIKI